MDLVTDEEIAALVKRHRPGDLVVAIIAANVARLCQERHEQLLQRIAELKTEAEMLMAERDAAETWLREHGQHAPSCSVLRSRDGWEATCDCGLDELRG